MGIWACFLSAAAQDPAAREGVRLVVDGEEVNWEPARSFPADSVEVVAARFLDHVRRQGFLYARADSLQHAQSAAAYISRGPRVLVGEVRLEGSDPGALSDAGVFLGIDQGDPFVTSEVERALLALLQQYVRAGYLFAEVKVASVDPIAGELERVRLVVGVDVGQQVILDRIELDGAARTRPRFVGRLTGLRPGRILTDFDPDEVRRVLLATDYFEDVGIPELLRESDDRVRLVIPLRDAAPGAFDLVMGYTPETGSVQRGGLVGNGHLQLRNLFGGGRDFSLRLNRLPGRVSTVDVAVADPGVLSLPVGIELSFNGVQQDSTYDQQRYGANLTYALGRNLTVVAGATREITKPGLAGLALRVGAQRIPRSTASFVGAGVRFESLDWPVNPRRGVEVETMFERGNKNRTSRIVDAAQDTLTERTRSRQERLRVRARYYVPLLRRQVVVAGVDARMLISENYDESDLVRFGGANSLRGYNEEQFLGRLAGRAILEVRHRLDRYAYAFVFTDIGYLEVPDTPDLEARKEILPGFGFGIQFRTPVGLINASYAFNDSDSPIDGRVHVGLSFSL